MNEEIDVSKCAFYSKGKCNNPNGMACNCRNTAICYFKELKRLELKNKKLKEKLETLQDEIGYLQQVLLQIKDIAMCVVDCEHDCDHCMQGRIHQLIKETLDEKG